MNENIIFISYRRDDTQSEARVIFEQLKANYGEERVFFDHESIEIGSKFPNNIANNIKKSIVVLVIIGKEWLNLEKKNGQKDWVRQEIETALKNNVKVLPVLIENARMPEKDELPESIQSITDINAAEFRLGRDYEPDLKNLKDSIELLIKQIHSKKNDLPKKDLSKKTSNLVKNNNEKKQYKPIKKRLLVAIKISVILAITVIGIIFLSRSKHKIGDIFIESQTGMEFFWIPGACYMMGCGEWAKNCESYEKPPHEVCIDGFWMGKTEVTQEQWKSIMNKNPSANASGNKYPVEYITWDEAIDFIDKLNKNNTEDSYRLPTEAEWEYACRSGGKHEYYSGGDVDKVAWHKNNSDKKSHKVAQKASNGLSLFDMSGNVQEWCKDTFASDAYSNEKYSNVNPEEKGGGQKVVRGGSWCYHEEYSRCTARFGLSRKQKSNDIGFRIVKIENQASEYALFFWTLCWTLILFITTIYSVRNRR